MKIESVGFLFETICKKGFIDWSQSVPDVGGQHCPCPVYCPDCVRIFLSDVCLSGFCLSRFRQLSGFCPNFRKKLYVACLSGRKRTRQRCPDFRCPCLPTYGRFRDKLVRTSPRAGPHQGRKFKNAC